MKGESQSDYSAIYATFVEGPERGKKIFMENSRTGRRKAMRKCFTLGPSSGSSAQFTHLPSTSSVHSGELVQKRIIGETDSTSVNWLKVTAKKNLVYLILADRR